MSKEKSPLEKKRISLAKDRRNIYGECPTSSRKNIRRGKQRSHMEVRRAANEELRALRGASAEADVDAIDARAKNRILALARSSFKKVPDAPLGLVVARKVNVEPSMRRVANRDSRVYRDNECNGDFSPTDAT